MEKKYEELSKILYIQEKKRKEKKKQRMKNEQKVCDSFSPASAFFSLAVSNRVPNFSLACDFFCGGKSLFRMPLYVSPPQINFHRHKKSSWGKD